MILTWFDRDNSVPTHGELTHCGQVPLWHYRTCHHWFRWCSEPAITLTHAGVLSNWTQSFNQNTESLIQANAFCKCILSAKWWPFYSSLNVLQITADTSMTCVLTFWLSCSFNMATSSRCCRSNWASVIVPSSSSIMAPKLDLDTDKKMMS